MINYVIYLVCKRFKTIPITQEFLLLFVCFVKKRVWFSLYSYYTFIKANVKQLFCIQLSVFGIQEVNYDRITA